MYLPQRSWLRCVQDLMHNAFTTVFLITHVLTGMLQVEKEKKRKDYAFRRHFHKKPSIMPGCLGMLQVSQHSAKLTTALSLLLLGPCDTYTTSSNSLCLLEKALICRR